MNIKDIQSALSVFEDESIRQTEATEQGDFRTANRAYNRIVEAATYLKAHDTLSELQPLLSHSHIGVRSHAAYYLLPVCEAEALKTLEAIAKSENGVHSLNAEMVLNEILIRPI